jgi:predicted ABC-type transport system involved in lysophospholipase L1 biosynthesis ATPase subunit
MLPRLPPHKTTGLLQNLHSVPHFTACAYPQSISGKTATRIAQKVLAKATEETRKTVLLTHVRQRQKRCIRYRLAPP